MEFLLVETAIHHFLSTDMSICDQMFAMGFFFSLVLVVSSMLQLILVCRHSTKTVSTLPVPVSSVKVNTGSLESFNEIKWLFVDFFMHVVSSKQDTESDSDCDCGLSPISNATSVNHFDEI